MLFSWAPDSWILMNISSLVFGKAKLSSVFTDATSLHSEIFPTCGYGMRHELTIRRRISKRNSSLRTDCQVKLPDFLYTVNM